MKQRTVKHYKLDIDKIDLAMKSKKIRKAELARRLRVSRMSITYWFENKRFPRLKHVIDMSSVLEIPQERLIIEKQ